MKRVFIQWMSVILVLAVVWAAVPTTAQAEAVVAYTVESVNVSGVLKEGETVTLRIGVMPVKQLCMMEVVLKYDEELFEAVEGHVSSFVASHYEMASVNVTPIDNLTGEPLVGTVVFNAVSIQDTAVTTKTALATVVLKARRDLHFNTEVTMEKMLAAHTPAKKLACEGMSGKITIKKGDVNGDGMETAYDALMILRHANSNAALSSSVLAQADVNGDGGVTAFDALGALKIANSMA